MALSVTAICFQGRISLCSVSVGALSYHNITAMFQLLMDGVSKDYMSHILSAEKIKACSCLE